MIPQRRADRTTTRGWVIWHLMEHEAHHGGAISLISGATGCLAWTSDEGRRDLVVGFANGTRSGTTRPVAGGRPRLHHRLLVVAVLVARRGGLPSDAPFTAWVQGLPLPIGFWEACTILGGVFLVLVGVLFVAAALLAHLPRLAVIVAVTLIAAALFTDLVKDYIARPRPPGGPLVPAPGYSFPSGHTLNSTATYGLLAFVAWRHASRRRSAWRRSSSA